MRTLRQLHWVTMLLITFGFYSCERLNPEEQDKDDVIVEEQSWTVHIKADIGRNRSKKHKNAYKSDFFVKKFACITKKQYFCTRKQTNFHS